MMSDQKPVSAFGPSAFFRLLAIDPSAFAWLLAIGYWLLPLLAVLLFLTACRSTSPQQPLHRYEFSHPAMGTLITITLYAPDSTAAKAAAAAAFQRIDALEDIMSDYQADSELMRLCDQPYGTPVPVSQDLFYVLQRAQKMSKLSDGAFDRSEER